MNFVFISPHFPKVMAQYCIALNKRGIRVLGLGDCPYDQLSPELKGALTEYYYAPNLNDFAQQEAGVAYFESKYGHIDYIESNNEWWLASDARLRERFGVTGSLLPQDMEGIKAKSAMKEFFARAGAKIIRYVVYRGKEDEQLIRDFVKDVGFPIFAKPNIGVGAGDSHSIKNEAELQAFLEKQLPEPYIVEEYIDGIIVSFDGVCDADSNVVFVTTDHFPTPIADLVNENEDYYYADVPFAVKMEHLDAKKFMETGRAVVKSFGIKKRMFHIEFFVLKKAKKGLGKKGDFVALECNMRAPGGYTPDLMNYGNSISMYEVYADVIAYNENRQQPGDKPYYAFASHRKFCYQYRYSWDEIKAKYGNAVVQIGTYPPGIREVMGDEYIFARFNSYEEGVAFDADVREKAN